MKRLLIFTLFCFVLVGPSLAQQQSSPLTLGVQHTIESTQLNQDRTIQVYTPDTYSDSSREYPVLYILDAPRYFLSGVAVQTAIKNPRAIPEMIVVGITTQNPLRRTMFSDKSEDFTGFLTQEVLPFIDSNYRTSDERLIFGWEDAAYYISELILKNEAFDGAIISNGGYASEELVKEFDSKKEVYLFIANSKKDIYNIGYTDEFHEVLKKHAPKNLKWEYRLFNDEIHESLSYLAIYKGLKHYYHNYNSLVFESIQEYIDLGGMDYLTSYFEERGKRFGFDQQIDNSTKNALIWLAWKRDNFEYFNIFMTEFKDVLSTQRYASAYWQNRFGQFYLKHKDYPNAIKYFTAGLTQYPNSSFEKEMQQGLNKAKSN